MVSMHPSYELRHCDNSESLIATGCIATVRVIQAQQRYSLRNRLITHGYIFAEALSTALHEQH